MPGRAYCNGPLRVPGITPLWSGNARLLRARDPSGIGTSRVVYAGRSSATMLLWPPMAVDRLDECGLILNGLLCVRYECGIPDEIPEDRASRRRRRQDPVHDAEYLARALQRSHPRNTDDTTATYIP